MAADRLQGWDLHRYFVCSKSTSQDARLHKLRLDHAHLTTVPVHIDRIVHMLGGNLESLQ